MPKVDKINVGGVWYDLQTSELGDATAIDGVLFDGSADIGHYAVCNTAADTAAKTATITGFTLVTGAQAVIKFVYGNSASSPTLNINSTGAKPIVNAGWKDGDVLSFVYDGTNWDSSSGATDTTLTISGVAADAKAAGDKIDDVKDALYSSINGVGNINNEHFFAAEIAVEMITGTRGSSAGASVNISSSTIWMCSTLIPIAVNDILTFVNFMPDKYRFVVRGYTENEANNGVFVSGGGPVALYQDGTEGGNIGSSYSNTVSAVYKNTVAIAKQKNANTKYLSVHVRRLTGTTRTQNDVENIQNCIKVYNGNQKLNEAYLPIVNYDKRTPLGDYGELISYRPFEIDTVNLTGGFGNASYSLKSGKIRRNNPTIDFTDLDASSYQTIYYDVEEGKILVTGYGAYIALPNVDNTIYLGSVWASNSLYPNGYFQVNGCHNIIVNGKKQLEYNDYNRGRNNAYKSIVMFGDSILQGQTTGETGVKTEYVLQNLIPIQWGIDAVNLAVGGSGWCHREGRTSDLAVKVANTDISEYEYILFFSGTNDYGMNLAVGNLTDEPSNAVGASFCASVKYVLDNVFTQNPDIEAAIITPTFRNYQSSGGTGNAYTDVKNAAGNTLGDFCEALVNIGMMYNVPVYDMRRNSIINHKNYATMLHPQNEGSNHFLHPKNETYKIMNHKIMEWLKLVY